MKARFKVESPDSVEYTMTLTMQISQWEELRDQLVSKWPSSRLSQAITTLLSDVRRMQWYDSDRDALS